MQRTGSKESSIQGLRRVETVPGDAAASRDQAARGVGKLLESRVGVDEAGLHCRSRMDHAGLKLGDLDQCRFDAVFDRADLRGDFMSGIFDHLFAHNCSFPGDFTSEWLMV